jgi:hypothetical protein
MIMSRFGDVYENRATREQRTVSSVNSILYLIQIGTIAFGLHVVAMDEP